MGRVSAASSEPGFSGEEIDKGTFTSQSPCSSGLSASVVAFADTSSYFHVPDHSGRYRFHTEPSIPSSARSHLLTTRRTSTHPSWDSLKVHFNSSDSLPKQAYQTTSIRINHPHLNSITARSLSQIFVQPSTRFAPLRFGRAHATSSSPKRIVEVEKQVKASSFVAK